MQILHSGGFDEQQREYYYKVILKNIKTSILRMIAAATKMNIKCDIKSDEINFYAEASDTTFPHIQKNLILKTFFLVCT